MGDEGATRGRLTLTLGNALTFVGMIALALSVYYNGANMQTDKMSSLRADVDNLKAAVAQIRSDNNALHTENIAAAASQAATLDHIKDQITEIKVLVAKGGGHPH
jgi:outer membrane murein-binding lipoprotein Lpp